MALPAPLLTLMSIDFWVTDVEINCPTTFEVGDTYKATFKVIPEDYPNEIKISTGGPTTATLLTSIMRAILSLSAQAQPTYIFLALSGIR